MAKGKGSDSTIGGGIIFIIVLIAMIPKEVWIALGIGIGISILLWLIYKAQIAPRASPFTVGGRLDCGA